MFIYTNMRYLAVLSLLAHWLITAAADYFPYSETWPEPRQPGWDRACRLWAKAQKGDTCWQIASQLNIDVGYFMHMNPQLQGDCEHNLWAGYWYCLGYHIPPGPDPTTLPPPKNTETAFITKSTDRASFSVITEPQITTPLTTASLASSSTVTDNPFLNLPPPLDTETDFTTKSTDAASFRPITPSGATLTIQFVRGTRLPVL
ncbi:hypothetical protein BR93DRAFT_938911 [Coniochaeta sp. PMI_546]|nr:hypothetical protein BR93DRAFT_938911 [Coniochaeta sp. PMI_546]